MQQKYEYFAQAIATGISPEEAYTSAGYSEKGARQSAQRLLNNAAIRQRIDEIRAQIQQAVTERIISGEVQTREEVAIASKNEQVRLKGQRYMLLEQIRQEQAAFFKEPGNQWVQQLGGLKKMPGVTTGYVKMRLQGIAGRAVPHLEIDTALLREMEALENSVAELMGFRDPVKAMQIGDTNNVQVVRLIGSPTAKARCVVVANPVP